MEDEKILEKFKGMVKQCVKETKVAFVWTSPYVVNEVTQSNRMSKEFRFDAQVGDYEIQNIIFDLGSDVNILPKSTWEIIPKQKLTWSPIQLSLENQHQFFLISRLTNVPLDIDGVNSSVYFDIK